ncbi:hypothetical protein J6590_056757 [Homalodisca vitripennis]|nr:hypothetical protein J6590_056757 [Homalodisca vitripennis]
MFNGNLVKKEESSRKLTLKISIRRVTDFLYHKTIANVRKSCYSKGRIASLAVKAVSYRTPLPPHLTACHIFILSADSQYEAAIAPSTNEVSEVQVCLPEFDLSRARTIHHRYRLNTFPLHRGSMTADIRG